MFNTASKIHPSEHALKWNSAKEGQVDSFVAHIGNIFYEKTHIFDQE